MRRISSMLTTRGAATARTCLILSPFGSAAENSPQNVVFSLVWRHALYSSNSSRAERQNGFIFDTIASCDDTKQPLVGQTLLSVRDDVAPPRTRAGKSARNTEARTNYFMTLTLLDWAVIL